MLKSHKTSNSFFAKFSPEWEPDKRQNSRVVLSKFQFSSIQCTVTPRKGRVFLLVQASIVNDNLLEVSYFIILKINIKLKIY